MADIIINKGLVNSQGNVVTGSFISNLAPSKIIYTGDVESEIAVIKKWAVKLGATFEQKTNKKYEPKIDKTEPVVEELFPEDDTTEKIVKADKEKSTVEKLLKY